MKKKLFLLILVVLITSSVYSQIVITGSNNADGTYTSLTKVGGAFQSLNTKNQAGASILITITSDVITENGANSLAQGAWDSLKIIPQGPRTISGASTGSLIFFNGADRVCVDGLNTDSNSLVITNTTSSTTAISTIKFGAGAKNIKIINCTILGSGKSTSSSSGTIFFTTGSVTGNDSITVSHCKIGPAGTSYPTKAIYSQGLDNIPNSAITISNCEIYNYSFSTANTSGVGIYATIGNTDWVISNNKFYHTIPLVLASSNSIYPIYFVNNNSAHNIQIIGNTIGYSSAADTGTIRITGSGTFAGIYFSVKSYSQEPSLISSNTIANISFESAVGKFYGIRTVCATTDSATLTTIVNNNTVKNIVSNTGGVNIFGIYAEDSYSSQPGKTTLIVRDNTVKNFTRYEQGGLYGIQINSGTYLSIVGNRIDSLQTINSTASSEICGIDVSSRSTNVQIDSNVVSNIFTSSTSTLGIQGINAGSSYRTAGITTMRNNTIYNLTTLGAGSMYGIIEGYSTTPLSVDVSGNYIHSLNCVGTVTGIDHISGAAVSNFNNNKIVNLNSTRASVYTKVIGFAISAGTNANIHNNVIGDLHATNSQSLDAISGLKITGYLYNIYHNTIYLNTSSSANKFGTACLAVGGTTQVNLINNCFTNLSTPAQEGLNADSNGVSACLKMLVVVTGSNLSYAPTCDNNLFWCNPSAGTKNHLVYYESSSAVDKLSTNTLTEFRALVVGRDLHSIEENPNFVNVIYSDSNFLNIDTSIGTNMESGGKTVDTVANDFMGNVRFGYNDYIGSGSAPDIGAFEFDGFVLTTDVDSENEELDKNDKNNLINLFPNPANDIVYIKLPNTENTNVSIIDISGKLIYTGVHCSSTQLDVSNLNKGVYIVKTQSPTSANSYRLIVY